MSFASIQSMRKVLVVAWTTLTVLLVWVASTYYTMISIPTDDDFCRARLSGEPGAWIDYVTTVYNTWSGRWAVHVIYGFFFPHIGILSKNYNLLLLAAPIGWTLIFTVVVKTAVRERIDWLRATCAGVVLTAVFWTGMPDTGDIWYWLTGVTEYELPILVAVLVMWSMTSPSLSGGSRLTKATLALLLGLAGILVAGLNELIAIALSAVLVGGVVVCWSRRTPDLLFVYVAVLLMTAAGLAVNVLAPGTSGHAASYPHLGDRIGALRIFLFNIEVSPLRWLTDTRLLLLSILLLTWPAFSQWAPAWTRWRVLGVPMAVAAPCATLLGVLGLFGLIVFSTGEDPAPRVSAVLYAFLIFGLILSLLTTSQVLNKSAAADPLIRGINVVASILFPLSLLTSFNMAEAKSHWRETTFEWRAAIDKRHEELRAAAREGQGDVILKPITARGTRLFRWREFGPEEWRYRCTAEYFGLNLISVQGIPRPPALRPDAKP